MAQGKFVRSSSVGYAESDWRADDEHGRNHLQDKITEIYDQKLSKREKSVSDGKSTNRNR